MMGKDKKTGPDMAKWKGLDRVRPYLTGPRPTSNLFSWKFRHFGVACSSSLDPCQGRPCRNPPRSAQTSQRWHRSLAMVKIAGGKASLSLPGDLIARHQSVA
jgi:hypothetical protein